MELIKINLNRPRQTTFEIKVQEIYYDETREKTIKVVQTDLVMSGIAHMLRHMKQEMQMRVDDGRLVVDPQFFTFQERLLGMCGSLIGEVPTYL